MDSITRRRVVGCTGIAILSGCVGFRSTDRKETIEIGNIQVYNAGDEQLSIIVRLDDENRTVYQDSIEVAADESELLERTWTSEASEYTLSYATRNFIRRISLPDDIEDVNGDCVDISLLYIAGEIRVDFGEENPPWGNCSE